MSGAPEAVEPEVLEVTAPVFAWEVVLNVAAYFFQRKPGGGMQLKFSPVVAGPNGPQPDMPGFVVEFPSGQGWEDFKRRVVADGAVPTIQTARHFPGGPLNGNPL